MWILQQVTTAYNAARRCLLGGDLEARAAQFRLLSAYICPSTFVQNGVRSSSNRRLTVGEQRAMDNIPDRVQRCTRRGEEERNVIRSPAIPHVMVGPCAGSGSIELPQDRFGAAEGAVTQAASYRV